MSRRPCPNPRARRWGAALILATTGALVVAPVAFGAVKTELVSVSSAGEQDAADSTLGSAVSTTGRFVAFASLAKLAGQDQSADYDVFVRDRKLGQTERVSASIDSNDPLGESAEPAISGNGRFVAFQSSAEDLVGPDSNGRTDVFVTDRASGVVELASVTSSGEQGSGGHSVGPSISLSGRFVAFASDATDLVSADENGVTDVFVRDRSEGTTRRVSLNSRGKPGNGSSSRASLSADGRFVAFESDASNLVPRDTNKDTDIFVRDRKTGTTTRISVSSRGGQANDGSYHPSISADGRFVAFESLATNLAGSSPKDRSHVYLHDRVTGVTRRMSISSKGKPADDDSTGPRVSGDGRFVVFESGATNLTPGGEAPTEVYVRDRRLGKTRKLSVGVGGAKADGLSGAVSISADGRFAAFTSTAANLVSLDTNAHYDIFVRGPLR
jgi:Tol biopolymer transport system component